MSYARTHLVRPALGATPIDTATPEPGVAQPPIYPLIVGSHGAYREVRSSAADGACGVHGYPCQHPGVDVAGTQGTPVVAPETGTIVMVANGLSAPFVGYGPWLVIVQGESGKFHLLAHLDPDTSGLGPMGAQVTAGQQIGTTSSANHTHWEVRTEMTPPAGEDNFSNGTDPISWLQWAPYGGTGTVLVIGGAALLFYLVLRRRS